MTIAGGSGGGSVNATGDGGSGGGYIYLQAQSFHNNGTLLSLGGDASKGTDSGGGSGGTIFISTYFQEGMGTLDVSGGSASIDSSNYKPYNPRKGGGAGSGGRIKLIRFDWFSDDYYKD